MSTVVANVYGTYSLNNTSNSYTYTTNNTTITTANSYSITPTTEWDHHTSTVKIKGNADVEGDLLIKGKSITKILDKIEERLGMLKPNPELEERWDELKELSKRYHELEAELLNKEKVWKILKK